MFALDIENAKYVECAKSAAAGTYGPAVPRDLQPGAYVIRCDADVVVRDGSSNDMRLGNSGNKVELLFQPGVIAPPVILTQGRVVVAAVDGAAVVWFIPLVSLAEHLGKATCG